MGLEELALVRVRPPEGDPQPLPPETLEFEHRRYRVVWSKGKLLRIRAPRELVEKCGVRVDVSSDSAGIVVRSGRAKLSSVQNGSWFEGEVKVEGRILGSAGTLAARLGDERARCRVVVEQSEETLPKLKIEPVDEEAGTYRALFDPAEPSPEKGQVLKVMTRHPALRPIIGDNFEKQDSSEWKAVLAEVVTDAFVRRLMERKFPDGAEPIAANDFYIEMYGYSTRLLPRMQRVLGLI